MAVISGLVGGLGSASVIGLTFGVVSGLGEGLVNGLVGGLVGGLVVGPFVGVTTGIRYGGRTCFQHLLLRLTLWSNGSIPRPYVDFLDYAAERIILRKVGGGYIFIHRLLQDHFAAMYQPDRVDLPSQSPPPPP